MIFHAVAGRYGDADEKGIRRPPQQWRHNFMLMLQCGKVFGGTDFPQTIDTATKSDGAGFLTWPVRVL
jgi:hypothetical protein